MAQIVIILGKDNRVFKDACGRPICNGAQVYYTGNFPATMPVLDNARYNAIGEKHSRRGIAIVDGGFLKFVTHINGKIVQTGLTWTLDDEPCYDLIVVEELV